MNTKKVLVQHDLYKYFFTALSIYFFIADCSGWSGQLE